MNTSTATASTPTPPPVISLAKSPTTTPPPKNSGESAADYSVGPAFDPHVLLQIKQLALSAITPDPRQPRKLFDADSLAELAASIKADGVIEPILVRALEVPATTAKGQALPQYCIIAGERRWRAAKLAGHTEIPALVRADRDAPDIAALQLVENLQRADLTLPEQCAAVAQLVKQIGLDQASARLGKSKPWLSKRAGVMELPKAVQDLVAKGQVVDVEIAAGLGELMEVALPATVAATLKHVANPPDWRAPLTRDDLRDTVRAAKDEKQRKEKDARDKAAAAKDPKAIAAKAADNKQAEKQKAKKLSIETLNQQAHALVDLAITQLLTALGFKIPKRTEHGTYNDDTPLFIGFKSVHFNQYDTSQKIPASIEGMQFGIRGYGNADHLDRMAKQLGNIKLEDQHIQFGGHWVKLKFTEGIAILKALKHRKELGLDFTLDLTHAQLLDLVKKHTGKALTPPTAPVGRQPIAAAVIPAKPASKKSKVRK